MTLNDLISTKHFDEKEYNSLMNSSHQRKENNTEIHDYNCGGYAFETYNWVELFDGADTVEDVVREGTSAVRRNKGKDPFPGKLRNG